MHAGAPPGDGYSDTMASDEPAQDSAAAEFRRYIAVLRRRRMVVFVTAASVVATAILLSFSQTPEYQASVNLLLTATPSEHVVTSPGVADAQRDLVNEVAIIASDVVREAVSKDIGDKIASDAISATLGPEGSDVIRLTATTMSPTSAARLANHYAKAYITWRRAQRANDLLATGEQIQTKLDAQHAALEQASAPLADLDRRIEAAESDAERSALADQRTSVAEQLDNRLRVLQNQLDSSQQQFDELQLTAKLAQSGGIQLLSTARAPAMPASPRPKRDALVALAIGLLLGLAAAFVVEFLDDSIKDKADLESVTGGLPVLALIPKVGRRHRDRALFPPTLPPSNVSEAYRSLRMSLDFIAHERKLRTVQFTSASAGEGKTTTVANLGVSLAQARDRVILVGCDLRRPRLHEYFGAHNRVGLTTALVGNESAAELLQTVSSDERLLLIPSGPVPLNPSELLGTRRAEQVLEAVASRADIVLVDTTPVLPVTDALVVSRLVDATVLVVAANRTSKRQLRRAVELLHQADAPLVGTVLAEVTGEENGYKSVYWHDDKPNSGRRKRKAAARTEARSAASLTSG